MFPLLKYSKEQIEAYFAQVTPEMVALEGETLAVFYTNRRETLDDAAARYLGALEWGAEPPVLKDRILGVVS